MASPTNLPVLDIGDFRRDPLGPGGASFVAELRSVGHGPGAFYLTGHGVDPGTDIAVHDEAARFFALPEADRLEIENVRSPHFRGYTRLGHERTNGRPDHRDQLDVGREQPAPPLAPGDPAWLRLRGPNLWPAAQPTLRDAVTAWMDALEGVGRTLLRAVAAALGQPLDHFDPAVDPDPEVLTKVIRYPARPPERTPVGGRRAGVGGGGDPQGVGLHRDSGFLTFVHQDQVGGLQVERDGAVVDVPRVPGAYVVNFGEMLQLVSRGYLRATVHRVVSPPPGVERISVAYFFNPKLEATLVAVDLPAELAVDAPGGASIDPSNPILANYGANCLKVRLRAHPDVAARHHVDLLTGADA
jgi:isopenicillin N synthase-like dioxygenase